MTIVTPEQPDIPSIQFVDGFPFFAKYSAETFRSAVNYKPRPDDIFVVSYPKSGTTWTQYILALIFRQGQPIEPQRKFFAMSSYLDITGPKGIEMMPRPGAIKVHFPFHMVPWSEQAKYIYVIRNPKDICVSYYHNMINVPGHAFNGTFDQFFELFLTGNVAYGDFFDHLLGWYEHRNDPNVLFLTYEEMKEDTTTAVLKIASFIDDEKYAEPLRRDKDKLNKVLKYSSFKYMKEVVNKTMDEFFTLSKENAMKTEVSDAMKKTLVEVSEKIEEDRTSCHVNFVRKGIVGDWKNYFTDEQSRRLDQKFAERTKGTEIANFWKNAM